MGYCGLYWGARAAVAGFRVDDDCGVTVFAASGGEWRGDWAVTEHAIRVAAEGCGVRGGRKRKRGVAREGGRAEGGIDGEVVHVSGRHYYEGQNSKRQLAWKAGGGCDEAELSAQREERISARHARRSLKCGCLPER